MRNEFDAGRFVGDIDTELNSIIKLETFYMRVRNDLTKIRRKDGELSFENLLRRVSKLKD